MGLFVLLYESSAVACTPWIKAIKLTAQSAQAVQSGLLWLVAASRPPARAGCHILRGPVDGVRFAGSAPAPGRPCGAQGTTDQLPPHTCGQNPTSGTRAATTNRLIRGDGNRIVGFSLASHHVPIQPSRRMRPLAGIDDLSDHKRSRCLTRAARESSVQAGHCGGPRNSMP